jgi:hypothetical protein
MSIVFTDSSDVDKGCLRITRTHEPSLRIKQAIRFSGMENPLEHTRSMLIQARNALPLSSQLLLAPSRSDLLTASRLQIGDTAEYNSALPIREL